MSLIRQRRHEEVNPGVPERVKLLDADHPALRDRRSIFPNSVVEPGDAPRLLVSGFNNRKIGRKVTKGPWAGMPIYTLTLEERASCPTTCHMWAACYGNAMNWARRLRHGPELERLLVLELARKAELHPEGFVVRLHVLGDFYSVEYVDLWRDALARHSQLRIYGYTARLPDGDPEDKAIALRIMAVNSLFDGRCLIRWSRRSPGAMAAVVIDREPEEAVVPEGIVCPAETQAASCCADCGLCWSPNARDKSIVFIRHGLGSRRSVAIARGAGLVDENGMRPVQAVGLGFESSQISAPAGRAPYFVDADPRTLLIDEAYQRSLSGKGILLIREMVRRWDWSKFKPPVVTEMEDGRRFAIDGQHTAIAAASHPEIETIPVQVIDAESMAQRAQAFLGHNRDRIAVTPLQLHRALVAANDPVSLTLDRIATVTGARILATPPPNGVFKIGDTIALGSLRKLIELRGEKRVRNILMTCVKGHCAPITADHMKAVDYLIHAEGRKAQFSWHRGGILDAADVALFLRARGSEIDGQATRQRADNGSVHPRWVMLAQQIYCGLEEHADG